METIRNYLESMFARLPATPEVYKAKQELLSMMEDKYSELREEGKPENEAVAVVISEFGNLDELAEDLGIEHVVTETKEEQPERRTVTEEEVKAYSNASSRNSFLVGLGVFFLIMSPVMPVLMDALHGRGSVGAALFFVCIAAGIGIIICGNAIMDEWKFLKMEPCMIDYLTADFIQEKRREHGTTKTLLLTIGIILCAICFVPFLLMDDLVSRSGYDTGSLSVVLMFLFIGVGVWLIIFSNGRENAYKTLLELNPSGTMSQTYVSTQKGEVHYSDPTLAAVMEEYWFTVTCLYLIISFLTFKWWISWIIWPIAAVIKAWIDHFARKEGGYND